MRALSNREAKKKKADQVNEFTIDHNVENVI